MKYVIQRDEYFYILEKCLLFDLKFSETISKMKDKNLAVELLKELIAEQVWISRRANAIKSET